VSFTHEITEELVRLPQKKTCCRKALALGFCLAARPAEEGYVLYLYQESVADLAETLLDRIFHARTERNETVRAGRRTYVLSFRSAAVSAFLETLDGEGTPSLREAAGFRCPQCEQHFLRGVILTCATVTDPAKGYHMELLLPTKGRADAVASLLTVTLSAPTRVRRGERYGVCYKSNGAIFALLHHAGCAKASFDVTNASIEKEIRNNENRATNCVARNISRSVEASQKQRAAIERLIVTRKIDTLSEELRTTAKLRMENEDASLTELALLHEPPLTKSGLNRRLQKLLEIAEDA